MRFRTIAYLTPVLFIGLLLLGGWFWLGNFTRHGVHVRVPDLAGLDAQGASDLLAQRDLQAEVIDSIYDDEARKGTVVYQDPRAGHDVKPGRKIYLILNATQPKMINMPRLVDMSKRQAISTLDIIGLKVKELQYKPDPCLDCVVQQLYKGQPIAPEARIRRGEPITLVLGSGTGGERVPVPDLRGSTFAEVQAILNMASMNLGVVVECRNCNTKADSTLARVHRQSPSSALNNHIPIGGVIDIWLTADTTNLRPSGNWRDSLIQKVKDQLEKEPEDGK